MHKKCVTINLNENYYQLTVVSIFNMNNTNIEESSVDNVRDVKSLGELPFNQKAKVIRVQNENPEVQCRLLTLGLYPGVEVEILRHAPMGDPLQVRSGTTLLSIRKHEAGGIEVEIAK